MNESDDIPKLLGYVSVKEAAEILNISEKMVYFYIENKRIHAVRASNILLISTDELEKFKQRSVGRPRTKTPGWRISTKDNQLFVLTISVKMWSGKHESLTKKLDEIRKNGTHYFLGTVARYIFHYHSSPDRVEIQLIWKTSIMPDETARHQALADLQHELADRLDWQTAHYVDGMVLMHT